MTDVFRVRRRIGFCPQFDALFDLLTGREHLTLYAHIKGISATDVPQVVEGKIAEMGLTEYADRAAGSYSGGNKRKLSVAIAMIGEPSLVFLDEPSTGMDPVARRHMWEIISDIVTKRETCSLILTTHSMEECEALCTRMGIMVGGVLRCLGSSQRLKSRYGHGFQLEFTLLLPTPEEIEITSSSLLASLGLPSSSVYLKKDQVHSALRSQGKDHWISRIAHQQSGADIASSLETSSAHEVDVKELASFCVIEERFDGLNAFLIAAFTSFILRERQTTRIRIEVSATQGNLTSTVDNEISIPSKNELLLL